MRQQDIAPAPGRPPGHVVFCADENYLTHLGVAAFSLLVNNPGRDVRLTVVSDHIGAPHRERLARLSATFNVPITTWEVEDDDLRSLEARGHITSATYFRLLMPRLLPADVDEVLYLDSDLVVNGRLDALWDLDISAYTQAACIDHVIEFTRYGGAAEAGGRRYFNSGVMLINLRRWREEGIAEKALAHAAAEQSGDQDALNTVAGSRVLYLDPRWNFTVYSNLKRSIRDYLEAAQRPSERPAIVHYTGRTKPWQAWCVSEHRDLYARYRQLSPWRDEPFPRQPRTVDEFIWTGEVAEAEGRLDDAVSAYKRALGTLYRLKYGVGFEFYR